MPKGLNQAQSFTLASIVTSDKTSTGVFTGNLRTVALTGTGRAVPTCDCVSLILSVTATTTDAASNLRVFLQHSWDGGTTWTTAQQFAAVTSSTDQQTITFRTTGIGANEVATRTSTVTGTNTAIVQNCVLATDQRIGWVMAGTGVTTATFTLGAICQPMGTSGV